MSKGVVERREAKGEGRGVSSRPQLAIYCLLIMVYGLLFTACRPNNVVEAVVVEAESMVMMAEVVVTETAVFLAEPVISVSGDNAAPATPTPIPTPVPTEIIPTATNSPTAMPTFTPPALPNTSPWEHYWLRRPVAEDGIVWTNKTYPYGHTRGGMLRPHHGVEFDVDYNTEILAAASGTIVVAGSDAEVAYGPQTNFYGNLVVIELDSKLNEVTPVYILYGHLAQVLVQVGQHVAAEQIIALSGASGVADGPHLHFEVRVGQNSYESTRNPLLWLYPFPDRGVVAGRVMWANSELAAEAPVTLRRLDGPSRYAATTTYAHESINGDDGWQENFAFDDVDAGYYEVTVTVGGKEFEANVWVYPFQTSFVEILIEGGE
ncbi:MAG: peptidoglycan DD-metalloendopeptidase family protein [Ardenticatenaceae bacterium]|nr:peptidoglycan DD-metalloendopeptidase family protein [Ardenticatenaceae bacterium]